MKIITTSIQNPLEERALALYSREFDKKLEGFVLFPEDSININNLDDLFRVSNEYNIGIAGTLKESNYQKFVVISDNFLKTGISSYTGKFVPNINNVDFSDKLNNHENNMLMDFYKNDKLLDFKVGNNNIKSIVRICSDLALPYINNDVADFLLIPSEIEHPFDWFAQKVDFFKKNLDSNSKILYAPSEQNIYSRVHKDKFQHIGIYDVNFKQLGEVKKDYVVLDY